MASTKKLEVDTAPSSLTDALQRTLAAHVPPRAAVCVALSGGRDSLSLLHAAWTLRTQWTVSACHVVDNHTPQAAGYATHCRRWCAARGIPCAVVYHTITDDTNEAWARDLRLQAFAQQDAQFILLAHHLDDQAETILFRFVRGATPHSLAAMREHTTIAGKTILRPWLAFPRARITAYAKQNRLQWVEDHDNHNLARRRNVLRRQVLPALEQSFVKPAETMAAAAERMQEASDLLSQLAAVDSNAARCSSGNEDDAAGYRLDHFRQIGAARMRNWLYWQTQQRSLNLSEHHIGEVARQLLTTPNRPLTFNFGTTTLHLRHNTLHWTPPSR